MTDHHPAPGTLDIPYYLQKESFQLIYLASIHKIKFPSKVFGSRMAPPYQVALTPVFCSLPSNTEEGADQLIVCLVMPDYIRALA